jgi:hypothetical protein
VGIKCLICQKPIPDDGIKSVGMHLRYKVPVDVRIRGKRDGNVFVTVLCPSCGFAGDIETATAFSDISQFTLFINEVGEYRSLSYKL